MIFRESNEQCAGAEENSRSCKMEKRGNRIKSSMTVDSEALRHRAKPATERKRSGVEERCVPMCKSVKAMSSAPERGEFSVM